LSIREEKARAAFEQALAMYLALPEQAYGRIVVHFGSNGTPPRGGVEAQLPPKDGHHTAKAPARFTMPDNR
jgi:hypothetical protein